MSLPISIPLKAPGIGTAIAEYPTRIVRRRFVWDRRGVDSCSAGASIFRLLLVEPQFCPLESLVRLSRLLAFPYFRLCCVFGECCVGNFWPSG